jgi:hypothetical protein
LLGQFDAADTEMTAPQSLVRGAAGIALFAVERAAAGAASWETAHHWLAASIREGADAGEHASAFYGAPALAFVFHGAAGAGRYQGALAVLDAATAEVTRHRLDAAHARLDRRERPALAEFDLIYGLTGLGAHLLRRDPQGELIRDVLAYLVRLTEPLDRDPDILPGWWTDLAPNGRPSPEFPGGHGNFGMAHGVSGPLALLGLAARYGVTVEGHLQAVGRICAWLDRWQQNSGAGPWWPEWITLDEYRTGRLHQTAPLRPSWCYGTPGQARAQQLAALATGGTARRRTAEAAALACLSDQAQLARITDGGLCHGLAGLVRACGRIAADAAGPEIAEQLAGLRQRLEESRNLRDCGFLEGTAGLALALGTVAGSPQVTGWDRCLLLD